MMGFACCASYDGITVCESSLVWFAYNFVRFTAILTPPKGLQMYLYHFGFCNNKINQSKCNTAAAADLINPRARYPKTAYLDHTY